MTRRPEYAPRLVEARDHPPPGRANLADLAYDRIEELLVTCALPPGLHLSLQELEAQVGVGRTPVHQAVSRLASDTLILVKPRHGLQVASIDLSRERRMLGLRRDLERFVVRLATERSGATQRNQLLHVAGVLRRDPARITLETFNELDRRIDRLLVSATGEAFLDHVLRPLHTIFRRIGWIYHSLVRPEESLTGTLEAHLAILDAVAGGRADDAVAASDNLIAFVDGMFDVLGQGNDPALFDCNLGLLATG